MSRAKIKARIDQLRSRILEADYAYYQLQSPTLSDYQYDQLLRQLIDLELKYPSLMTRDSPSVRVGGGVSDGFESVQHDAPVLSLQNGETYQDVVKFVRDVPGTGFVVEPKMDGLSLVVKYDCDGHLLQASTRGDGKTGENVTRSAQNIANLPRILRRRTACTVRGEVVLPRAEFQLYNEEATNQGHKVYKNPRNAASGAMRQLNPMIPRLLGLRFYAYDLLSEDFKGETQQDMLNYMEQLGFCTSPLSFTVCGDDAAAIFDAIKSFQLLQTNMLHDLDGAVVKANQLSVRNRLGSTSRFPRWALAFKYPPEVKVTTLEEVTWQVGRTGAVTPVATVAPVELAGTTVTRATVHNASYLDYMGLHLGDKIEIQKAGEIIPQILGVHSTKRDGSQGKVIPPTRCPSCELTVYRSDSGLYCRNTGCGARIRRGLEHFCSRAAMDIEGVGPEAVEKLVSAGVVKSFSDLLDLNKNRLKKAGITGKTADNLVKSIEGSKSQPLSRLLVGLGIEQVGTFAATELARKYSTLQEVADGIFGCDDASGLGIKGLGPTVYNQLCQWFAANRLEVKRLSRLGTKSDQAGGFGGPLSGKVIVLTGQLSRDRGKVKQELTELGARVTSSVSRNTDYIIAGDAPGPKKLAKAEELSIRVIGEKHLQTYLDDPKQDVDKVWAA